MTAPACFVWLIERVLDGRAVPSAAAADEDDADALELDSAPALLLPLPRKPALSNRGGRVLGRLHLRDRGQRVTARPLLTKSECSTALLFGLMIP